ncbi:MAG: response regulator [Verrucomicrobia bacterium]|nr:response regulator [Verrucomicrobiota bacterium]
MSSTIDPRIFKVLLVEDDEDDYLLTRGLLSRAIYGSFDLEWAATFEDGLKKMAEHRHDVYLIDYRLGAHNGIELMKLAGSNGCRAPLILVAGQGDHQLYIEAMESGAADYMVKGEINAPLLERSIRYAIARKQAAEEQERLIAELKEALAQIKTISGLIPICAGCKKIRDDEGFWQQLESYISRHSDAVFSHGLCPECVKRLYPDFVETGTNAPPPGSANDVDGPLESAKASKQKKA